MITNAVVTFMIALPTVPKPDLFECRLQWIHDIAFKNYVCVYKCADANTQFEWYENKKDRKGCAIHKRYYRM